MAFLKNSVLIVLLTLSLTACGSTSSDEDDDDANDNDDTEDNAGEEFALTSSINDDGFEPGGVIPDEFTCEEVGGQNNIPKLSWSNVPDGTLSFALTVIDLTPDANGTIHAIYINIPSTTTSLSQSATINADNVVLEYFGPCPVGHSDTHTYEATLYALNVAELEVNDPNDTDAVITAIEAAAIDSDAISGTFTAD